MAMFLVFWAILGMALFQNIMIEDQGGLATVGNPQDPFGLSCPYPFGDFFLAF